MKGLTLPSIAAIYATAGMIGVLRGSAITARYAEDIIYIPFGLSNRVEIVFGKTLKLDYELVHEIGHHIWHKTEGEGTANFSEFRDYRELQEGFCCYLSNDRFRHFYPERKRFSAAGRRYERGYARVKKIVELNGEDVLFDIPSRWREFTKG